MNKMDTLDEQLAQLKLINTNALSPKQPLSSNNHKKIGPAVPPKPLKKVFPQVPRSSAVKQACEPLYSKRLQADEDDLSETYEKSSIPLPHVYSNMKLTLDNSAILDQQLEALEYHKKQLERKGILPVVSQKTTTLLDNSNNINERPGHVYSNPLTVEIKKPKVKNIVYSNIINPDELPPPPLDMSAPITQDTGFDYLQQNCEDELPPPPSPVSSSYSELRRATDNFPQMPSYPMQTVVTDNGLKTCNDEQQTYANTGFQNDYSTYGLNSQGSSSTYESIYEPINPRPPSQLSSHSNYSLYAPYVNGPQKPITGSSNPVVQINNDAGKQKNKETEVEALTDLLIHSLDNGTDTDNYGVCVKCNERIVGENSGCTAMERIYHITCFTCSQCQINLQGKPFYALEGKPYCKDDYLNTFEKCSVCMKPILERILRATGKPYHPGCFCCVVCGNSLDGIPFTVDATNQNYCIEDFHKKFAPRCCVCRLPIMPEPGQEETVRVVALDRSFHFECYRCEDCDLLLSSEAEGRGCYPLDDHVLCKSCNAKRVQALTSRMTTEL